VKKKFVTQEIISDAIKRFKGDIKKLPPEKIPRRVMSDRFSGFEDPLHGNVLGCAPAPKSFNRHPR